MSDLKLPSGGSFGPDRTGHDAIQKPGLTVSLPAASNSESFKQISADKLRYLAGIELPEYCKFRSDLRTYAKANGIALGTIEDRMLSCRLLKQGEALLAVLEQDDITVRTAGYTHKFLGGLLGNLCNDDTKAKALDFIEDASGSRLEVYHSGSAHYECPFGGEKERQSFILKHPDGRTLFFQDRHSHYITNFGFYGGRLSSSGKGSNSEDKGPAMLLEFFDLKRREDCAAGKL